MRSRDDSFSARRSPVLRILALETSGQAGSVAALAAEQLLGQVRLTDGQRSGQALAPAIAAQLTQVDWRPADLQLIVVTSGPGSFTGLRVGVTTAKTLAYATGAALVAVNTLDVCAHQMVDSWSRVAGIKRLLAVMDAQRGQFFAGLYARAGTGEIRCDRGTRIEEPRPLGEILEAATLLTGPGARKLLECLPMGPQADELLEAGRLAPDELMFPTAEMVGRLGYRLAMAGHTIDPFVLIPEYYRASAAEEKLR